MSTYVNPLTPNDHYSGRTTPLTSKRCILYIYSTNIGTECFKHDIHSPLFSLQNAVCFIILTYLVPSCIIHILYTGCAKIKKKIRRRKVKATCQYPSNFTSPSTFPFSSSGAQAWQSREAHFCDFSPFKCQKMLEVILVSFM